MLEITVPIDFLHGLPLLSSFRCAFGAILPRMITKDRKMVTLLNGWSKDIFIDPTKPLILGEHYGMADCSHFSEEELARSYNVLDDVTIEVSCCCEKFRYPELELIAYFTAGNYTVMLSGDGKFEYLDHGKIVDISKINDLDGFAEKDPIWKLSRIFEYCEGLYYRGDDRIITIFSSPLVVDDEVDAWNCYPELIKLFEGNGIYFNPQFL